MYVYNTQYNIICCAFICFSLAASRSYLSHGTMGVVRLSHCHNVPNFNSSLWIIFLRKIPIHYHFSKFQHFTQNILYFPTNRVSSQRTRIYHVSHITNQSLPHTRSQNILPHLRRLFPPCVSFSLIRGRKRVVVRGKQS